MQFRGVICRVHSSLFRNVACINGLQFAKRLCQSSELSESSSVTSNVETICKNVMIDILRCFLQRDDMPLACDLFLKGIFLPTSKSWIPVVDTQPLLHR